MEGQPSKNTPEKQPVNELTSKNQSIAAFQQENENGKQLGLNVSYSSYTGTSNLPPPEIIKVYAELQSDAVDRILKMAENQATHRQNVEQQLMDEKKEESKRNYKLDDRGQIFGFVIVVLFLVLGAMALWLGHLWTGGILAGIPTIGIAGLFLRKPKL